MNTSLAIDERIRANTKEVHERFTQKELETDEIKQILKDREQGIKVRISDLINDNFISVMQNKRYGHVLKGGRSSMKSSVVSLKLLYKFLKDDRGNVICFRKVAKYLSTSVYEQIKWAIYKMEVENEFTFYKSPLKIEHNTTGTAFYFYGVDDPIKIKSAKIAVGHPIALWFEEAAEFESIEEIDTVSDTFIREDLPKGEEVDLYFTYNPPRNPYVWINEWVEQLEADMNYLIHHSTYKEDLKGFLSKQFLDKVKKIEETDPEYHDYMYEGKVIGLGDTIYNYSLFTVIDELPDDDRLLFVDISIDTGYSVSATTFLYIGYTVKGNIILLDTYYYSPVNKVQKKAPSQFSKDYKEFLDNNRETYNLNVDTETVDSADGATRNQINLDYGIYLTPARKKKKQTMIENVETLLVESRVYVLNTPRNKIFLDEHKKYQWDPKSLEPGKEPQPIKVDDHTCDAFQYYVNNNLHKLGLKG